MTAQRPPSIQFREPWVATTHALDNELVKEVGKHHVLEGKRAVAIGRRVDNDDVLFYLPDGPSLLAVVHLTWTGRQETKPEWPWTELFDSADDFVTRRMNVDAAGAEGAG